MDTAVDLGLTAAYVLRNFEREPIELGDPGTAGGIDTDRDGKFDLLQVVVPVDFLRAGFYNWSARLVDLQGGEIALAAASGSFASGPAALTLEFNGCAIGTNGVDGPFAVRNFIVFGPGASLNKPLVLVTDPLLASQFACFTQVNQPPTCEPGGPYQVACAGRTTSIALDGTQSRDPEGALLSFAWTTDCPGASFDDATSSTPVLSVVTPCGSTVSCMVQLTVSDGLASESCSGTVQISSCLSPGASPRSIGFWKGNLSLITPLLPQILHHPGADIVVTTTNQAATILRQNATDMNKKLRAELLTTLLNLANGSANAQCIQSTVAAAQGFLEVNSNLNLRANHPLRPQAEALKNDLNAYNEARAPYFP